MNYSKVISGTLIAFTIYMSVKNGLSLLRGGVAFNEMVAALHVPSAVMNGLIGITLLSALQLSSNPVHSVSRAFASVTE